VFAHSKKVNNNVLVQCPSRSKSYIVNNQLGKQSWFECDCWKWLSVMYWYFEGSQG